MATNLHKISAYLDDAELKKFRLMIKARGDITESAFIREMLGFEVKQRGAPKGKRKQKIKETTKKKSTKAKKVVQKKARSEKLDQLSFLD